MPRKQDAPTSRQGVVPIEIVFALPVLLFTFGFVFVTVSAGTSRVSTSTEARHNALRARHTPGVADPLEEYEIDQITIDGMDLPARMLRPDVVTYQGVPADAAAATSEADQAVDPIMRIYQPIVSSTQFEAAILGGVWDHQDMPFRRHARLTLTDRAPNFAVPDAGAFAALGGFGGVFTGHSGSVDVEQQARATARQEASRQLGIAQRLESRLVSQLRRLLSKRKKRRSAINATRRAIREVQQGIRDIQQAQQLLGE